MNIIEILYLIFLAVLIVIIILSLIFELVKYILYKLNINTLCKINSHVIFPIYKYQEYNPRYYDGALGVSNWIIIGECKLCKKRYVYRNNDWTDISEHLKLEVEYFEKTSNNTWLIKIKE